MASACWWYLPGPPATRATAGVPHGVRAFVLTTTEMLSRATDGAGPPGNAGAGMISNASRPVQPVQPAIKPAVNCHHADDDAGRHDNSRCGALYGDAAPQSYVAIAVLLWLNRKIARTGQPTRPSFS